MSHYEGHCKYLNTSHAQAEFTHKTKLLVKRLFVQQYLVCLNVFLCTLLDAT